MCDSPPNNLQI